MSAAETTPAIELRQVTKRFGPKTAVQDVSLSVPCGACFGLIGPNGAGKTTLFSMACGFLAPSGGSLSVMGVDPSRPGVLKGKVGVLPQDAALPQHTTVGALLTYWARLSKLAHAEEEARDALQRVELPEAWDLFPQALSHGMAKRVSLAQALMGRPPLLLLDEPTAGLDPKVAAHVRGIVESVKGRQTVIVSSHNLQELEALCDGAAILDHGRLVQSGSMSALTSQGEELQVSLLPSAGVPLLELRGISGIQSAELTPDGGQLSVRFDAKVLRPEEAMTRTLSLLIENGALIRSAALGRSLEARVLELT